MCVYGGGGNGEEVEPIYARPPMNPHEPDYDQVDKRIKVNKTV